MFRAAIFHLSPAIFRHRSVARDRICDEPRRGGQPVAPGGVRHERNPGFRRPQPLSTGKAKASGSTVLSPVETSSNPCGLPPRTHPIFQLRSSSFPAIFSISAALVLCGVAGSAAEDKLGEQLIADHGCVACHTANATRTALLNPAPDLRKVGERIKADWIEALLAAPREDSRMPHLTAHLKKGERKVIAWLLADAGPAQAEKALILEGDAERGSALFHKVGCVACHGPAKEMADSELGFVAEKYYEPGLAAFLFQPLHSRPGGRMPDMSLSKQEAADIARFLIGDAEPAPAAKPIPEERATQAKALLETLSCNACHSLPDALADLPPPPDAPALDELDTTKGCLAELPAKDAPKHLPHYTFTDAERTAIRAALGQDIFEPTPVEHLALNLAQFNCAACHDLGDELGGGGVPPELDDYFTTSEPGLGNEARIPPPLGDAGAKLNKDWMHRVLFDREQARPYMHTRMPQFGEAHLGHLPDLFAEVADAEPLEIVEPGRDQRKVYREAGHKLMGDKGLACITCHNFNGHKSPGMKGIDLITSHERLKPRWMFEFLRNPASKRPGIVMPSYWPGGEATRTDILDGDTDEQLQAMWYFLSLGRSARTPSGVRSAGHKLLVGDKARLYRGRSRVAGYRGIAIGLPGGINAAYNAETGALAAIWQGEFINVGWNSQGAGDFNPAGRPIQLAQDLGMVKLASDDTPWPLRPTMTKENPVNPDPTYARKHGYQFGGYMMTKDDHPIVFYSVDGFAVLERLDALASLEPAEEDADERNGFRRRVTVSGKHEPMMMRLLTGKLERQSDRVFTRDKLQVTLPAKGEVLFRPLAEEHELLLKFDAEQGPLDIDYELLP